jgi:hypothetical protein
MNRLTLLLALASIAALPAAADETYVATSTGVIGEYNTTTGAFTTLGSSSTVVFGLGYSGGTLYANDNGFSPSTGFYTVNPSNGALTFVGDISGATSGQGAITAPVGGGTLYYFDHSNQLFSISPTSGAATLIGSLGFGLSGSWDIDFAQNGKLYGTSNGNFYVINTATGAATLLGNSGVEMQGLVAGDGNLYGFSGDQMFSINLSNGAVTFVRDTPSGVGNFETGTPVVTPPPPTTGVPEPNTIVTLLCGLAMLGTLALWSRPRMRAV